MCTYNYSCRLRLNLNFLSGKRCHSLSHSHSRHAAARTRVASERVGCGCGAGSGAAAPAPMRHAAKETWRRRWRLERETHRCDCIDLGSDGLRRPHDRDAWIGQGSSRGPNTARWTPTRFGFSQSSSPLLPFPAPSFFERHLDRSIHQERTYPQTRTGSARGRSTCWKVPGPKGAKMIGAR